MVNFYRASSGVCVDWCVYGVLCSVVFGVLVFECVEYCLRGRERGTGSVFIFITFRTHSLTLSPSHTHTLA